MDFFLVLYQKILLLIQKAYTDPTAHGWAGYNSVFINGKSMPTLNGCISDMKINNFIELTIDCDKQTLFLWHSQQTHKYKLPVDIRRCPFSMAIIN